MFGAKSLSVNGLPPSQQADNCAVHPTDAFSVPSAGSPSAEPVLGGSKPLDSLLPSSVLALALAAGLPTTQHQNVPCSAVPEGVVGPGIHPARLVCACLD